MQSTFSHRAALRKKRWFALSFNMVYTPNYHQARYIHNMYIDIYVLDIYQIWPYKYDSYFKESILLRFLVFSSICSS